MKGKTGHSGKLGALGSNPGTTATQRDSIRAAFSGTGENTKRRGPTRIDKVEVVDGDMPKDRFDRRPGRRTGGRVGADKSPLSSAANSTQAAGHKTDC